MPAVSDPLPAAAASSRRASKPALRDVAALWRHAIDHDCVAAIKALHRPRPLRFLAAAAGDWMLIAFATFAVARLGAWAVPFALLVIGNRQRALGNLLHDASHGCLAGRRRWADVAANVLFCWPLGVSMKIYRDEHGRHHNYLGDPVRDPDFIHDETQLLKGWWAVWRALLFSGRKLRASVLGDLLRMDGVTRAGVVCWWALVLVTIATLAGPGSACLFLALWFAAKATAFHAITTFREISDHVGLDRSSLIGFSRSHPFGGVLAQFFHPHNNGYHLLHHLTPGMPFHALPQGHALLMQWAPYAAADHCDGYFAGPRSAVHSWVRRWVAAQNPRRSA